jgi:hypothetical protein
MFFILFGLKSKFQIYKIYGNEFMVIFFNSNEVNKTNELNNTSPFKSFDVFVDEKEMERSL